MGSVEDLGDSPSIIGFKTSPIGVERNSDGRPNFKELEMRMLVDTIKLTLDPRGNRLSGQEIYALLRKGITIEL